MARHRLVKELAAAALACLALTGAKPKEKVADLVYTHPDFARFGVRDIAMLPVVSFDRNQQAQLTVERFWGQMFGKNGYRWVSATFSRERLRAAGDSVQKAYEDQVRRNARVDSTFAPALARTLRARGVLTVRVDSYEKVEIEPTQSGRASTTIWLKAALVDSTGTLLWSISGNERLEGQQYDPSTVMGINPADPSNRPITGAAVAAPSYEEVLTKLLGRWATLFPPVPRDSTSG